MNRAVNDIIADMISTFKKMHVKQLYRLKREFEEEDWEMISANTKYVSYFLSPVCATCPTMSNDVQQTPKNLYISRCFILITFPREIATPCVLLRIR